MKMIMPELPEVETIARTLSPEVVGNRIAKVIVFDDKAINLSRDALEKEILGKRISDVWRRGKMLVVDLEAEQHMIFHLKMSGNLLVNSRYRPANPHERIHFILDNGKLLVFRDMRRFGWCRIRSGGRSGIPELMKLGPEPFEISLSKFYDRITIRKARIKSLLLDQTFIAGVGNIYADESLFAAEISPLSRGVDLTETQVSNLYSCLHSVLHKAIEEKGSTIMNYTSAVGEPGSFQIQFFVYGRANKKCFNCEKKLKAVKVSGRTSVFCPNCQR